ncbi:unnamed protein product, partial [Ectocarpus fasciculatus]
PGQPRLHGDAHYPDAGLPGRLPAGVRRRPGPSLPSHVGDQRHLGNDGRGRNGPARGRALSGERGTGPRRGGPAGVVGQHRGRVPRDQEDARPLQAPRGPGGE